LIFRKIGSYHFQNVHKFLDGIALNHLFIAFIAQEKKRAGANVDHDALDAFSVAHGVPLITHIL